MSIALTRVSGDSLRSFTGQAFEAMGLSPEDAATFADALIFSELRFHPGHGQGVRRLRVYQGGSATDSSIPPRGGRW